MTTKPLTFFTQAEVYGLSHAPSYGYALNRWLERSGVSTRLGEPSVLAGAYATNRVSEPGKIPPQVWPALIINIEKADSTDNENGGTLETDTRTGSHVVSGMKIHSFAEPGSPRFSRHLRTIAHEMQHAYNPLEGYHLLTQMYEQPMWDWRKGTEDAGGIFGRNPGLRQDPWVDTQSDFEKATMCEFNRLLWEKNIRNPWGWSERGWFGDSANMVSVYLSSLEALLGFNRGNRMMFVVGKAYDLHEFLLAELKTGKREINTFSRPEVTPPPAPESPRESVNWVNEGLIEALNMKVRSLETENIILRAKLDKIKEVVS